jgi:catechol 2,3-dioxygenase-like lactoylglutathione lyase family enzyme
MTDDVHEVRVALTVQDFDAALRLYREGLGLEVEAAFENTPDGDRADLAPIAYAVPSGDHLHTVMASAGPDDLRDPVLQPATSGALLSFTDPDGHRIHVYSIEGP